MESPPLSLESTEGSDVVFEEGITEDASLEMDMLGDDDVLVAAQPNKKNARNSNDRSQVFFIWVPFLLPRCLFDLSP